MHAILMQPYFGEFLGSESDPRHCHTPWTATHAATENEI